MEFNFPAIVTGVVTRLDAESAMWSSNVTHLLINPIGIIGLFATGQCLAQLTMIEDGMTPAMIFGKYRVAESMHILVEQVTPMPSDQPPPPDSSGVNDSYLEGDGDII